jgi:prepilin peptidase CpaA
MPESFISQARLYSTLLISMPIVIEDLRARRVPNRASIALFFAGLALAAMESGLRGIGLSLAGALAGSLIFVLCYALGGMGAGDIKLMAACGSIVGFHSVVSAALITALAGTIIALVTLAAGAFRRKRPESIPYAPAIISGTVLVLLGRAI